MDKKSIIKIVLILLTIFSLFIYFSYYFSKKIDSNLIIKATETEDLTNESNENVIKGIRYYSENKNGDSYVIFSDYGKINLENTDLTYMTNVTAIVNLKNSEEIQITSNFANFNHISYETEFFEKVIIIRGNEKITSEKLKFSLEENVVVLSKDVIFNKPGFNLKADRVEIDLITKNSKIIMNGKEKKVIVIGEGR
jgi:LPS export ABC transporter protein LptC|tara:strand:+ start:1115 stop:1702 length:588 start_codon:yes stop_codon:yes gene_type:complete